MAKRFDISVIFKAIDKASPTLKKIGRTVNQVGKEFAENMKNRLQVGALAMTAFAGVAAKTAADFQGSMNFVGAVSRANAEDLKRLKEAAIKMGEETQFSAIQAAKGMEQLGLAGFDTNQIIGAMPKVLELATAAQLSIGDAARIVTGVMGAYQFQVKDLTKVNDVMVNAFTKAKVSLPWMGEFFSKLGPKAKMLGLSFKEMTAVGMTLSKVNMEASISATGLKSAFDQMLKGGKTRERLLKDMGIDFGKTGGKVKTFTDIIIKFQEMQKKGVSQTKLMTIATKIFGVFGANIVTAVFGQGAKQVQQYQKALDETGTATKVAGSQMKGLKGAFEVLKSKIATVQITMFDTDNAFGRFFEKQIRNAGQMVGSFNKWLKSLDSSVYKNFIAAWKRFSVVVFGFGEGVLTVVNKIKDMAKQMGFFNDKIPDQEELESLRELGQVLGTVFTTATVVAMIRFANAWTLFIVGLVWVVQNWAKIKAFFTSWGDLEPVLGKLPERKPSELLFGTPGTGIFAPGQPRMTPEGRVITREPAQPAERRQTSESKVEITVKSEAGTSAKVSNVEQKGQSELTINTSSGLTLGDLAIP